MGELPKGARVLSLLQNVHTGSVTQNATYSMDTEALFSELKWPEGEAEY